MDIDQTTDAISSKISLQGIKTPNYSLNFKQISLDRLKSRIDYLRFLPLFENRRKAIQKRARKRVSTVEVFKELLMGMYVSDAVFMVAVMNGVLGQRVYREAMDCVGTGEHRVLRYEPLLDLRDIFKRKKWQRMNQFFYRLAFQQKKKTFTVQTVVTPRRRTTVMIQFAPSAPQKLTSSLKTFQSKQRTTLLTVLHCIHRHKTRQLLHSTFLTLISTTHSSTCLHSAPFKSLSLIISSQLQSPFTAIRAYSHFHSNYKKTAAMLTTQAEAKNRNVAIERVKELSVQSSELSNLKVTDRRRFEVRKGEMQEEVRGLEQRVGEVEIGLMKNQTRLNEMKDSDQRRRRVVTIDYFPLLKSLYNEYQQLDSLFIQKSLLLNKHNPKLPLNSLSEWPQTHLTANTRLKKHLAYYQGQLCSPSPTKSINSPKKQSLDNDIAQLLELIAGYIRDQYRYTILERLRVDYGRLKRQAGEIRGLMERGDVVGLRRVFGMVG